MAKTPQSTEAGLSRQARPCTMVIFGASGDLTRRKLGPALFNLLLDGFLPESFAVVGVGRSDLGDDGFRKLLRQGLEQHSRREFDEQRWAELVPRLSYVTPDPDAADRYAGLAEHLDRVDEQWGTSGNRLFYLATPPSAFPVIVRQLGQSGLNRPGANGEWSRVVIEKPIGRDLESACALNRQINEVFDERFVFRIDHYLGKEAVQNLLVFRFANAIFEPLWNQKYVDHVQITVAESIGVGTRASYFEEAGMTRDMLQNHMFQLVCLTAMEPPVSLEPEAIRDEKVKVLHALRPIQPEDVGASTVRAQYGPGVVDGVAVKGYREEDGVAPDSKSETYVAASLFIDNWRWAGVPFYLRAGKRLGRRVTEISLQFKDVPHRLFSSDPPAPNKLKLRMQPDEGIALRFDAKVPGAESRIRPVDMDFNYDTSFGVDAPEAYERLILDALIGDSTLFISRDEVQASWEFVDRLHRGWASQDRNRPLPEYTAGMWGPAESHVMLAQQGRKWNKLG